MATMAKRSAAGGMARARALLLSAATLALLFAACAGELRRFEHAAKGDGSLDVLVVGDWGRRGLYNQSLVASQMGKIGEQMNIDFVISTGDNFYEDGLTGINDTMFEESFTNVYTARSLQTQWYTVLGNHDYRGDAVAQLSPVFRKIDGRWLCLRSFIVNAEIVDFFFVDTSPFVLEYWNDPGEHSYDWRGVHHRENYVSNLLKDVELALKQSSAIWKIVVGHHTMRSVSEHGDTLELLESLLPILKANGVSMYINGHDHCLEHISSNDSPIQYFTSGAGSKAWRGVFTPNTDNLRFFYDGQGFMSLHLTRTIADLVFYDVSGRVLYRWSMTNDVHPAM